LAGRLPPTFLLVVVATGAGAGLQLRAGLDGADGCQLCLTSVFTNTVPPPLFTATRKREGSVRTGFLRISWRRTRGRFTTEILAQKKIGNEKENNFWLDCGSKLSFIKLISLLEIDNSII
jgi:hypothetical protein